MKIGILYICTGAYTVFWKDFYLSAGKNFLPGAEKHYFVFTDSPGIAFEKDNRHIHRIYQADLGWPGNTLRRFEMFLRIEKELMTMDYLFFCNANLLCLKKITTAELLPQGEQNLAATLHPGYFNKPRKKYTYETNPLSTACISENEGQYYFAGGFNGGKTGAFLQAAKIMRDDIREDATKNIIAVWHDESHWNRYLVDRSDIKILSPEYLYPEGLSLPFVPKIIVRDKKNFGGHFAIRNRFEWRLAKNRVKDRLLQFLRFFCARKIVKLQGGLGNQLFQYAYGRSLEISGKKVAFDISFFQGNKAKKDTARAFKLNCFNIRSQAPFLHRKLFFKAVLNKIKRRLGLRVEEFYQDEKYFQSIEAVIRAEFTLKIPLSPAANAVLDEIKNSSAVSLHIRRGDYITDKKTQAYHGNCSPDYYQKAIAQMAEKIAQPVFFIFSDDLPWCRKNLRLNYPSVFVANTSDCEDLILMSRCQHHIIANSTFSWWGAWLNDHPAKIVIAPRKWRPDSPFDGSDILLESWIKI